MKKLIAMLIGMTLIVAMIAGCSSTGTESSASESASTEASQEASASEEPSASEEASTEASTESSSEESASTTAEGEVLKRIIENGKLRMLTNAAFPPYEYLGSDNKPAGIDVDICQAVADQIGVELEVIDMDFDGLIPSLQGGKGDVVAAGLTVNEERQASVDFTNTYADAEQMIIVPKEGATVSSEDDLTGKTIGVQLGTTGDLYASDNIEGADVKQYKTPLEASMDLMNGRLDAVIIDKMTAQNIADSNEDLEVLEMASTDEQYAIAVEKDNEDLLEIINGVIAELIENGKIAEFTATHVEASKAG